MKTFKKFFGIIVIGAVIAAGLSACITISSAPPPSEEELAFRNTFENATWEKRELPNQPSFDGFEKLSGFSQEVSSFQSIATDDPNSDGREIGVTRNGVQSTIKRIYMAPNTWYELRAPELPGITYYYFRSKSGAASIITIYKNKQ